MTTQSRIDDMLSSENTSTWLKDSIKYCLAININKAISDVDALLYILESKFDDWKSSYNMNGGRNEF